MCRPVIRQAPEQGADFGGRTDADCVGQRDFLGHLDRKFLRDGQHGVVFHFAFERAAECGADGDLCTQSFGAGEAQHGAGFGETFGDGLALILLPEGVARHDHAADLIDAPCAAFAGGKRAHHAALVESKADIGAVGAIRQACDHGFGICHLGHTLRVDEARHLKPPRTIIDHATDHGQFGFGRDDIRLVLEPVARANFDQFDILGHDDDSPAVRVG